MSRERQFVHTQHATLLVLLIGTLFTVVAYFSEQSNRHASTMIAWENHVALHVRNLEEAVHRNIDLVVATSAHLNTSGRPSREDFSLFTQPLLQLHPEIQALEWIPRVSAGDRNRFERLAREEGLENFRITERDRQGVMSVAGERDEYFPVYYVEPLAGNEMALGFDLASETERLATLRLVAQSGMAQATAPITLVQEAGEQKAFLIISPTFGGVVEGFVLGVYRVSDLLQHTHVHTDEWLQVTDITDPLNPEIIEERLPAAGKTNCAIHSEVHLTVLERQWSVKMCPPLDAPILANMKSPWGVIFGGMLITLLLAVLRYLEVQRRISTEEMTETLMRSHEALKVQSREIELAHRQWVDAFDTVVDAIFLHDGEGRILRANRAYAKEVGVEYQDFIGEPYWHFFPLREGPLESCSKALKEKNNEEKEEFTSSDGRSYLSRAYSIRDAAGAYQYSMHIIRDISEQKKVRQALEESEESYRALFETSADALMLLDESHSIFDVNRAAVELFGFDSIDEMQGLRPADLSPERQSNGETVQLAIEKVAQASTQGMLFFEWLHTRKSGELFTADVLLSRVPIKGKEVIQATVRDISMRKEMEKQLEHEIRARRVVSASNQTLVHAQDESSLLQKACELICHEESYPLAMVGLKQDDTEKSIKVAGRAGVMTEADVVELGMTWSDTEQGQNMTAVAIRNSQIQINRDAQKKARCKACKDLAIKYDYHSILSFPLIHDGRVLGGLTIAASDPDAFSEEEIELLSELASDLSYGIVSLRSKEKREHAEQAEHEVVVKLERSTQKTVQAIASAIEVRDPYTAGHQQRVALLATAIANEMEMDENSVIGLALGATIHDIGKIYVPAEILNRPGKLTDAEFEIIKSHPRVGHDIIKEIDFPWPVGNMVLMHHERLDGSGYPQGLKGDEIPIEARILAVADVVEAIDSHRPYRPTLGIDFAMEEINKHRGSWYDSAVVDACVALIEREGTAW